MISELYIESFKCFEKERLKLKNLTVLTGTNGSGKSAVIQSILKLSLHSNSDFSSPLQNYLSFISDFDEAVNFNLAETDDYKIEIMGFDGKLSYKFNRDGSFDCLENENNIEENLSYSKGNLVFLSADRIGPQDTYEKNTNPYDRFGILGEYAISFLEKSKKAKYKVFDPLCKTERKFLTDEVGYWLHNILETEIETEDITGTNQVRAALKNGASFVRPKNIGSGISYLVSILVICLAAKEDNVIVIENPEIHLHPKAQSKLGEFFAFVASKGIQIILETHNDHLINKIRYEVFENRLSANDVIIHYKEKDCSFEQIEINEKGLFSNADGENSFPEGFYDATLKEIYKINRGK